MCKFIGSGIKEAGANLNVVNILRALVDDEKCDVYVPYDYQKENNYKQDQNVEYLENPKCKAINLVSNQERYNFSLVSVLPILVCGEQKQVYHNYTIIRDGELIVKSLWASVNGYYETFKNAGLIINEQDNMVEISFENIPLVSSCWAHPNQCNLYGMLMEDANLSETLKILRKEIKIRKENGEVLTESVSSVYNENREYVSNQDKKSVPCLVYDIADYKGSALDFDKSGSLEYLNGLKRQLDKRQADIRFAIRCIVYAIEGTQKKGSYEWVEAKKTARSTKDVFTTKVDYNGSTITLRKSVYTKNV